MYNDSMSIVKYMDVNENDSTSMVYHRYAGYGDFTQHSPHWSDVSTSPICLLQRGLTEENHYRSSFSNLMPLKITDRWPKS